MPRSVKFSCGGLLLLGLLAVFSQSQAPPENPIPPNPALRWFKGNLHTHSLWSDGNDFPEMIADWYRGHGYQFLALSDHNVLSEGVKWIDAEAAAKRGAIGGLERYQARFGDDWVETREEEGKLQVRLKPLNEFRALVEERGKFLMIQAEEITDHFGKLPIHINASNLRDAIKPQGGESVRDTIRNNLLAVETQKQRTGQPMLAHLNHPNFGYAVTAEDLADVLEEQFFEVYNGHPGVHHHGDHHHAGVERLWDGQLEIEVQPDTDETYTIEFIGTLAGYDSRREPVLDKDGKPLSVTYRYSDDVGRVLATVRGPSAQYKLTGKEYYVRAVITSNKAPVNPALEDQHKQAWTQPVGWEKWMAK